MTELDTVCTILDSILSRLSVTFTSERFVVDTGVLQYVILEENAQEGTVAVLLFLQTESFKGTVAQKLCVINLRVLNLITNWSIDSERAIAQFAQDLRTGLLS